MDELLNQLPESDRTWVKRQLESFDETDRAKFNELVQRFEQQEARNPIQEALSCISEPRIPQHARFLVLKELYRMIYDVTDNQSLANDMLSCSEYDGDERAEAFEAETEAIAAEIGEERLTEYLRNYGLGMMYNVAAHLLDDPHNIIGDDSFGWSLMEHDSDGELTGRNIGGLHEDFVDFPQNYLSDSWLKKWD
ncbi:MAG: hypothetical protein Q4D85_00075 [Corynebacterium sp.]|uniref:hypothetical protein n=1 Tax=Corynebacterium sp. TaxID=1720 RepID=UPI0026DDB9A1|nr:hypothetical protein [Corynebacterium sp.]MDO5097122.1 hypothetical protein [Corynebacterium sp.]